jgi:hypothetical protein
MALRPSDDFDRDILDIIPERYDADADSHQARAGHRLRTILTISIAVVAVGGIVAAGLHLVGGRRGGGMGVPVIKADDRPIKIRPDDRGGMKVPNQDTLVYERMESGADAEGRVETLLPPPETPHAPPRPSVPVEAAPAAPALAVPAEPVKPPPATASSSYQPVQGRSAAVSPTSPAPVVPPAPTVPAKPAPGAPPPMAAAPMAAVPAPVPVPAAPPAAKPQVITPAQVATLSPGPTPTAPAKPSGGGDYVVQLGAVRAADLADKEWSRIQKANADLLGGLHSDIVRVELGDKGVFWRVRSSGMSEQAARQLCTELQRRNQGCILVRN